MLSFQISAESSGCFSGATLGHLRCALDEAGHFKIDGFMPQRGTFAAQLAPAQVTPLIGALCAICEREEKPGALLRSTGGTRAQITWSGFPAGLPLSGAGEKNFTTCDSVQDAKKNLAEGPKALEIIGLMRDFFESIAPRALILNDQERQELQEVLRKSRERLSGESHPQAPSQNEPPAKPH